MTTPKPRAKSDTSRAALDPTTARIRDELIAKIKALIAAGGWTQQMAAELCGLTQPRISDLLRGNTSRFSLDALVGITAALERHSTTTEGGTMEYTEADGQRDQKRAGVKHTGQHDVAANHHERAHEQEDHRPSDP